MENVSGLESSVEDEIESEAESIEKSFDRARKKASIGVGVMFLSTVGSIVTDAYLFAELNYDTEYVLMAGTIGLGAGFAYCIHQMFNNIPNICRSVELKNKLQYLRDEKRAIKEDRYDD